MPDDKIQISWDEMTSARVEERLRQQAAVARAQQHYQNASTGPQVGSATPQRGNIIYNTLVYLPLFGLLGALPSGILWDIVFWNEDKQDPALLPMYLSMIAAGVLIACSLGIAESVVGRNLHEFVKSLSIGLVVGLIAGVIYPFAASLLMVIILKITVGGDPRGMRDLPFLMVARAAGWMLMGAIVGLTPGIALRSLKKTGLGLLGGAIGGLIGGCMFDPITVVTSSGAMSRLIGISTVGVVAGLAIGMLEQVAKSGWLKVTGGLITGKQFILYINPTRIGSSPDCEIYLFKDPTINPRHAAIRTVPGGFEIEDLQSAGGTYVNGQAIRRHRLRSGDQLQIGATTLQFQEKARQ